MPPGLCTDSGVKTIGLGVGSFRHRTHMASGEGENLMIHLPDRVKVDLTVVSTGGTASRCTNQITRT